MHYAFVSEQGKAVLIIPNPCTLQSSAELLESVLQIKDIKICSIVEGQRLSRDGRHISLRIYTSLPDTNMNLLLREYLYSGLSRLLVQTGLFLSVFCIN